MKLQVIEELAYIPANATVIKLNGAYEHIVKDEIVVYGKEYSVQKRIKPPAGYRFIIDIQSHSISQEEVGKKFIWHTTLKELNNVYQKGVETGGRAKASGESCFPDTP